MITKTYIAYMRDCYDTKKIKRKRYGKKVYYRSNGRKRLKNNVHVEKTDNSFRILYRPNSPSPWDDTNQLRFMEQQCEFKMAPVISNNVPWIVDCRDKK